MTSASAPGKVVLCGEYAVLGHAPAICVAVNRRAQVSLRSASGDSHVVAAPGHCDGEWRFRADGGRIAWLDPLPAADSFRLLEAIWQRAGSTRRAAQHLTIDTREFVDAANAAKLGLGSSAAVSVALTAVLGGDAAAERIVPPALDAHRAFQGGHGSGVDIAAAAFGGVLAYRRSRPTNPQALTWPAGLHCAFLFSGRSSRTADKLAALAAGDVDVLAPAAGTALSAWQSGNVAEILASLSGFAVALRAFDREHGLGIFAAGHAGLSRLAADSGVVYKPCGAGGGDIGAALADDRMALKAFVDAARARGFSELELALEPRGII